MSKQITLNKLGGKAPFADGGLKLSKSIRIDEIEMHPDFQSLFPIKDEVLNHIADSMKEKGFKGNHPVDIWFKTDANGTLHKYLMDGYTRVKAAKIAKLETVPYYEFHFETFDEALKEALSEQVDRRNLEGADLLSAVSKLYGTDFIQNAEGKKSEAIAEVLGVSPRTAEKAIAVMKDADEETLQQIENNEISVNKAYEKKHSKKSKSEERNIAADDDTSDMDEELDDIDDLSDSLDDSDGNPRGITVRSRDMTEHLETPEQSEYDRRLIERYTDGFYDGFGKGFGEGSFQVFDKISSLFSEGKTWDEIQKDDVFSDFTFYIIAKKLEIESDKDSILKEFNK